MSSALINVSGSQTVSSLSRAVMIHISRLEVGQVVTYRMDRRVNQKIVRIVYGRDVRGGEIRLVQSEDEDVTIPITHEDIVFGTNLFINAGKVTVYRQPAVALQPLQYGNMDRPLLQIEYDRMKPLMMKRVDLHDLLLSEFATREEYDEAAGFLGLLPTLEEAGNFASKSTIGSHKTDFTGENMELAIDKGGLQAQVNGQDFVDPGFMYLFEEEAVDVSQAIDAII